MAAIEIGHFVNAIPNERKSTAFVFEPTGNRRRLACVFKEAMPPDFYLLCEPGSLAGPIDHSQQCLIASRDQNNNFISLAADIKEISNERVLDLRAAKPIEPEALREYFRVNMKTHIVVSYDSVGEQDNVSWELEGETIDISQSGVLAFFSEECKSTNNILIQLTLPNPQQTVYCIGHAVRSKRLRKNRWRTAFHFDELTPKNRDIIARNCFSEQRKQLRERVHTLE